MKYIDEFRDPTLARRWVDEIHRLARRPVRVMEFCGGHTHAIFRFGLRALLAPALDLRAGPGCPVCVTAAADLDRAIALASVPGVILSTFGDMLKVPSSAGTLEAARGRGADVRIVYSPADAVELAQQFPTREVVFLGVGFETTAPGVAAALLQAEAAQLPNFSVLSLHKLTPPAMRAILDAGEVRLDGILGPGHVSAIIGSAAWDFLPRDYHLPCAVAGFEALDLLGALAALVRAAQAGVAPACAAPAGEPTVINAYARSVRPGGNPHAQALLERVFAAADAEWRGFGVIPASGLALRVEYAHRDAAQRFPIVVAPAGEPPGCRCGEVLRGVLAPPDCPLFGTVCTPRAAIGPCMVSAEGACAAYYQYQEHDFA